LKEAIVHGVQELIEDEDAYIEMTKKPNPYGDGMAAKRIVDFLASVE
ncbi:MAG: UDP-N-acetylglucosamine 2-epimerase (non-hydrolyzing), partial [Balneola sp.]|nr:UDP-N-acetylglucosamine 2-epimerase (non-hydrolyzing) [Balneola sp.]